MAEFNSEEFLSNEVNATNLEKTREVQLVQVAKQLRADAQIEVERPQKADVKAVVLQFIDRKKES